jgi:phenylalanyl-tRNA synthetase beta chain
MLCSQKELGLGEEESGIWILPPDTEVGLPLAEALKIDDVVLDVSITPNRGDCLSTIGIAREVAAICNSSLHYPVVSLTEEGPPIESLTSVIVDDPIGCPRYAARVVEGITIAPSPAWLRERLETVGVRPINNIVDVTNYVMMELGQPLHALGDVERAIETIR